ncbi:MAG: hypothetical protein COA47_02800 [Robiginitomaculum sp.]|nr:MAG: hypothetical protein COA47_02800 [Robiginitomaculum sp.]
MIDISRPTEIIRYITVQILTSKTESTTFTGSGTGFLYCFKKEGKEAPVLVTNKHVIEGAHIVGLKFHETEDQNKTPKAGSGRQINCKISELTVLRHPDPNVDLVAICLTNVIAHIMGKEGWRPFILCLSDQEVPAQDAIENFSGIEDISMVGYPIGIADEHNNFPVIRRGITATPYRFDYQGKREFLIDIAVYPGSSGSPVFILNEGAFATPNGLSVGTRFLLVGILYSGYIQTVEGEIVTEPIPTDIKSVAKMKLMANLGKCIKVSVISDLEGLIPGWNK